MVSTQNGYIVEIRNEDDGTTGGRKVLIDNHGRKWIRSIYSEKTAPTGVTIGHLDEYGRIWS